MEIAVGMHQNQGKREYQQDAMSIKNFGSIGVLAILADGMGGYEGGEIASKLVSENFREFAIEGENIGESLKKYLLKGNDAIKSYKNEHPEVKSMGTTAIAFFMTGRSCQWVSVGDSPLYVIRNRSTISRINENHSVAGLLDLQVKKGEITKEEALSSGQRHMLTSAISGEDIPQMDLSVSWAIKSDDIFILASDGIETISEDRIKEIALGLVPVVTQVNMQKACEALVQEVIFMDTQNQDNVTVIMLALKKEDGEPRTVLHKSSSMVNKYRQIVIGVAVATLVFLLAIVYFMMSGKKTETIPDTNMSQENTVNQQIDSLQVETSLNSKDTNRSLLLDITSVEDKSLVVNRSNSSKAETESKVDIKTEDNESAKKDLTSKIKTKDISPEEI